MYSVRDQKLLVILLAGMAISISSFGNTSKTGSRDFASYDDRDDDVERGETMAAPGDADDIARMVREENKSAKLDNTISLKEDDDNEVVATVTKDADGNSTIEVTANKGKDHASTVTIQTNKNDKYVAKRVENAQERSLKNSKKKKERTVKREKNKKELDKKIANCEKLDKKTDIDETDTDGKLSCFQDRLRDMDAKEKRAFMAKIVNPYVAKLKQPIYASLDGQDPTGANATVAKASLLELQQTLGQYGLAAPYANEFNLALGLATQRSQPNMQALQQNLAMTRMAQQIAMNPNISTAQKTAMQQQMQLAMTQQGFNTIGNDLGNRTALIQGLATASSSGTIDPSLVRAANNQIASLGQDAQRQMTTNSAVGKAYSGLINPNLGANTAMNVINNTDTFGLNTLFSSSPLDLAYGSNGVNSWNYNNIWTDSNNGLTNPSFSPSTLATTTLPVPQNAAVKNPQMASLKPMTLPR